MNKLQLDKIRKSNLNKTDKQKLSHNFNCVRINPGNSTLHELKKFAIAFELIKKGHKIATECVSYDGKRRFDILDFDSGETYEVEILGNSYEKGCHKKVVVSKDENIFEIIKKLSDKE